MRLINADALDSVVSQLNEEGRTITRNEYKMLNSIIFEFPTIKTEPVKHGRWIDTGEIWTDMYTADEDLIYKCSICNEEVIGGSMHFAYCPWCGARMEEQK